MKIENFKGLSFFTNKRKDGRGMLRSEFTGDVIVFAREHNERTFFYSIGISKKDIQRVG